MELKISDLAAEEFNKSVKDMSPKPFLRVGARPGGCSGWSFTLDTDDRADISDSVFVDDKHDIRLVIDIEQHETLIGDLLIDYSTKNLVEIGFIFKRTKMGTVCGCGESFTPINSQKKTLGWK
jgi:iron-sulfur cluster assembly protein